MTQESVHNGLVAYMALGGSTNAAVHLIAMAGRAGISLTIDDMAAVAREVPVLTNLFPSGDKLMEDFFFAGGMPALLQEVRQFLKLDALTVTGQTLGQNIEGAVNSDPEVIRSLTNPVSRNAALAVLRGNLCPDGAVIKPSAANPKFFKHRGPALVFNSNAEMLAQINLPELEVNEDTVLILRNGGPIGAPGMPEWGNLPIPKKLLTKGVRDMLRISDARMSGTHYGTCILHVTPEAAIGGPLALVKTGDIIELDVAAGSLNMLLDEAELAIRRASWQPPAQVYSRGYARLYIDHVTQADRGCDFDFLLGNEATPEPPIF